jgi:uncharacterized protein YdbL (DUF1318 family)
MRKINLKVFLPLWALLWMMACVTVNVYFPAKEVEKKAGEIVDEIRKKDQPPPGTPSGPQSKWEVICAIILNHGLAFAQKEAEASTPAMQQLKKQMNERFSRLTPFFQKGALGENNKGFLEMREIKGLSPVERNELKQLLEAENRDRKALYQEVATSMKIQANQIGKVQRIFADKWQQAATSGWWIQKEDGQWLQK